MCVHIEVEFFPRNYMVRNYLQFYTVTVKPSTLLLPFHSMR